MKNRHLLFIVLVSIFFLNITSAFFSCTQKHKKENTKHYSEEFIQSLEQLCAKQKSRLEGTRLIDSIYRTFPFISKLDKFRYYDFKQKTYELVRNGDRSYDTAILYVDSMIAIIEDNGFEKEMSAEYVKAFSTRGEYYTRLELYEDAISDISRCKQLNEKAGDSCLMGENTKTLSSIAINQSNFTLAASLVKDALQLIGNCKKDEQQFKRTQRYLDDLGFIYASLNKYDSALFYHLAAVKYIEQNKQLMGLDTLFPYVALENIYSNIGIEFGFQNKLTEAEFYLKKALSINKNILQDSIHSAIAQYWLGTFYLNARRVKEAKEMADESTLQLNNLEPGYKGGLLMLKAGIARENRQYEEEAKSREQLALVKDSLQAATIDVLKKSPFVEYEQLDKKYRIGLLEKDIRNQRNKATAAIVIGVLLILIVLTILYTMRQIRGVMKKRAIIYNQLVRREKELKETMLQKELAEKQLRESELVAQEMQLQVKFNEAIIEQRSQISDDMHDELSSSLAALKFYVEDIKNKSVGTIAEKDLSSITEEVGSVYQHARSYMHSLKTNKWEDRLNLLGFLKEIQHKFSEKGLMNVMITFDEDKVKSKLSTTQQDQLFHIYSEGITNIIKHSRASAINIEISFDLSNCYFSLTDNGTGFAVGEKLENGLGLKSIRNRVALLGGIVDIRTDISGTIVSGQFPI